MLAHVRRFALTAMRLAARDETHASAGRSALVLAPHPDDETLGCGATILRKVAAGTRVVVAVLTDGRDSHRSANLSQDSLAALRRVEMVEAARRLGLSEADVRWGGFVDGSLAQCEDDAARFVGGLLQELAPQEVYSTCAEEAHPDHAALSRAARRAVAAADGDHRLLEYPVWLWRTWPLQPGNRLGSTVDAMTRILGRRIVKVRADGHRQAKMHALTAHASQLQRPDGVPADEDWATLPTALLEASDGDELFLPWRSRLGELSTAGLPA